MVKVNEAYSVLINPARRLAYDSQLNYKASSQQYYKHTRDDNKGAYEYSEKKKSRWSFASPATFAIWIILSGLGKFVNNYTKYTNNEIAPIRQENIVGNQTIKEIFTPKIDTIVFTVPEINRIYDSLNPHY